MEQREVEMSRKEDVFRKSQDSLVLKEHRLTAMQDSAMHAVIQLQRAVNDCCHPLVSVLNSFIPCAEDVFKAEPYMLERFKTMHADMITARAEVKKVSDIFLSNSGNEELQQTLRLLAAKVPQLSINQFVQKREKCEATDKCMFK